MSKWFGTGLNVGEIRSTYRALALRWHPDRPGGDTATMQDINASYERALKGRDGEEVEGDDGRVHVYRYDEAVERDIMDIIYKLLNLRMPDVDIELVGRWVWVSGDTKPWKEQLGRDGLGLFWHSKRIMWYWKPANSYSRYHGADFDTLRRTYGSRRFEVSDSTDVAA